MCVCCSKMLPCHANFIQNERCAIFINASKCVPHVVASCSTLGSVKQAVRENFLKIHKNK